MKSYKKIEEGFLSSSPMYSILAFYMPVTTLIVYIFLLEALLAINLPEALFIASGAAGAVAASFYCDFMKNIKSSRLPANIRGGIIIMAINYFFASFFITESPLEERFMPELTNVFASACALYTWVSVISLKQLFKARRQFEIITEMYQGELLQQKLFEDPGLLQYTDVNITNTRHNYFFQLGVIGVLTVICAGFKLHIPPVIYILLIVLLAGGVCIHGLFEIIKWEQYYAGDGINLCPHSRVKRILAIIILSLSGFIFASLLSSDNNLIPFSLVTGFFTWFFSLFKRYQFRFEDGYSDNFLPANDFLQEMNNFEEIQSSPVLDLIVKYGFLIMKYGIIILASAVFIRFMISPLLNRGEESEKLSFNKKFKKIISEWFRTLFDSVSSFIAHFKNDKAMKLRKLNTDDISRTAETILGSLSPEKKRDMRRSVTLFARLIIWGSETRNVTWKPSHAPGEYCAILTASSSATVREDETFLQHQNEGIIRCGEIFEKALYSALVLSDTERREFKDLVEEITSRIE